MLGLVGHADLPYAQSILKLSATQNQRYGIVACFPWSIKPVIGMISDIVPIWGYNKRYYMFGASLLGAAAVAYLAGATLRDDNDSAMAYVAALVLINLQVSVVDLLTEGKYTEKMSATPEVSSDIVSFVWLTLGAGGLFATLVSFFVLPTKNYRLIFYCAAPFALQAVRAFPTHHIPPTDCPYKTDIYFYNLRCSRAGSGYCPRKKKRKPKKSTARFFTNTSRCSC